MKRSTSQQNGQFISRAQFSLRNECDRVRNGSGSTRSRSRKHKRKNFACENKVNFAFEKSNLFVRQIDSIHYMFQSSDVCPKFLEFDNTVDKKIFTKGCATKYARPKITKTCSKLSSTNLASITLPGGTFVRLSKICVN